MVAFLTLVLLLGTSVGSPASPQGSRDELRRVGEIAYREGTLPSGKQLRARISGDAVTAGMVFACASCHLRSGLGSFEENIYVPPANAASLFHPSERLYMGFSPNPAHVKEPHRRPAYTDETLVTALRSGVDPTGRALNDIMPRYAIDDADVAILLAYLKTLSVEFSPGVTDSTIRFATVISDEVDERHADAMFSPLERYFKLNNDQVASFDKSPEKARTRRMTEAMLDSRELATKKLLLSRWTLTGSPDTWRRQLDAYSGAEPAFALLGGLVNGDWAPIHRFCEDNRIPCLFPNTEFPVITEKEWYTIYLSKGLYQEGEAAARYLDSRTDLPEEGPVLQIVRGSREGQALARGFEARWQELGHPAPMTVALGPEDAFTSANLPPAAGPGPFVLVVWDDGRALGAIEPFMGAGSGSIAVLSSSYLGESVWTLSEGLRRSTYITYPYAFSHYVPKRISMTVPVKVPDDAKETLGPTEVQFPDREEQLTSLSTALTRMMTVWLMSMKSNYYRDNLLDIAGSMMDQAYPMYGRLSFGSDQRYASRGCYIVRLTGGTEPALVKESEWLAD